MKSITIRPSDLIGFKPCDIHKDPKHCDDVNNLTDSITNLDVLARVTIKKNDFDEIQNKTYIGKVHMESYDYFTNNLDDAIGTAKINLETSIWMHYDYRMTCNKAGFYLEGG